MIELPLPVCMVAVASLFCLVSEQFRLLHWWSIVGVLPENLAGNTETWNKFESVTKQPKKKWCSPERGTITGRTRPPRAQHEKRWDAAFEGRLQGVCD